MLHERKPNRMQGYDYSKDNLYFVTSCVHDRLCCFGNVVGTGRDLSVQIAEIDPSDPIPPDNYIDPFDKKMILNEYGIIAKKQWFWLAEQYPYVVLHEFVVMPNHIHGIIEINRAMIVGTGRDNIEFGGDMVGTGRDLSLPSSTNQIKIKSLSELMGAYKTTTSNKIHLAGFTEFKWQRSFHDHIIRDEKSYKTISDYIKNNPIKWEQDTFFNSDHYLI